MTETVGTKFNRKMFQLKTHLHMKEKTHDTDLRTAKARVTENKKLYKQILHCAEALPVQAFTPVETMRQTAEMINDKKVVEILESVGKIGFETIEQDLVVPLREHIEHYDDVQRRIDDCHKTRIDMDRHKEKLDNLLKKTNKQGRVSEFQIKYDAECDRYSKMRSEILEETRYLDEERDTIARPIMSSLLLCYTLYLDTVNDKWLQIRDVLKEVPPNFKFSKEENKIVPMMVTKEQTKPLCTVQSLYDFDATQENELSLTEGDVVDVLEENGDWWYGEINGKRGYFPSNYVRTI
ncbi:hypothetical protein EIN_162250 [Entamoeba invadens IP1]|uniref:SH3 domain-containing protein n=1 Tax=Entamoeba invadens IP1 TaxID=370355 RepID=A0A0A1TYJ5_ENTIV|nr:hypothetical protein EIN_162250 [Entamoeba invadens IP1]ELP86591.1 hypothetical protein EIN_162250 [Entamoeba invadens IP1]|eukprot:XP_004185937.1 hypothetical protein EIN_162250 [Entamoeba invadens IP1]